MTIDLRSCTGALAAFLSGILAALALTNPARMRWPVTEPQSKIDQWISSQSTSVVVGAIVAVGACAYLQHRRSRRRAWAFVYTGVVVLILIRFLVAEEVGLDLLSILGFAKTIAAGLILGGAVAASWDSRLGRNLLIIGVVSTWLAAQSSTGDLIPVSTSSIGEPAWALLLLTLICAVACAVTDDSELRISESEPGVRSRSGSCHRPRHHPTDSEFGRRPAREPTDVFGLAGHGRVHRRRPHPDLVLCEETGHNFRQWRIPLGCNRCWSRRHDGVRGSDRPLLSRR